jgi:hypothetical protein
MHHYLEKFVTPTQENQILLLSLDYLVRHDADNFFDLITGFFFSGVSKLTRFHWMERAFFPMETAKSLI